MNETKQPQSEYGWRNTSKIEKFFIVEIVENGLSNKVFFVGGGYCKRPKGFVIESTRGGVVNEIYITKDMFEACKHAIDKIYDHRREALERKAELLKYVEDIPKLVENIRNNPDAKKSYLLNSSGIDDTDLIKILNGD